MMNKISVIIPTYKRVNLLNKTLLKLNNQSCLDFNVVIINDDPDLILIKESLPNKLNYNVIIHNNFINSGPSYSRNFGVSIAETEWVCFLDDDDEFHSNKINSLMSVINEVDFDCDVIFNGAEIHLVDNKVIYTTCPMENVSKNQILTSNLLGGAPLMTIKKDTFLSLGGYSTEIKALEDYDLNIRVVLNNKKYTVIKDNLSICFYSSDKSTVSKSILNNLQAIEYIVNKYKCDNKNCLYSWIYSTLGYKSLLTKNKLLSIKYYCLSMKYKFKIKSLILIFLILINKNIVFQLRSKLN